MEIEAKFVLPDRKVLGHLAAAGELAGYVLGEAREQRYHDQFLDTVDRRLLAAGWYLRLRTADASRSLTLKGRTSLEGAVHRRQEWKVRLPEGRDPAQPPPGELQDRLTELTGGEPLTCLVALWQVRLFRTLTRDGRIVAELSLDRVCYRRDRAATEDLELEVELSKDGTMADLDRLVRCLRDEWHLVPQTKSKFERAMALTGTRAKKRARPAGVSGRAQ
ncbi:MAG: CYTH domain protein [Chloroflexi bacterium ADurb.Bin180]|nr:MAG: CYTH domain protein [Chloroflexi bacterium ADurb.Bin180]